MMSICEPILFSTSPSNCYHTLTR